MTHFGMPPSLPVCATDGDVPWIAPLLAHESLSFESLSGGTRSRRYFLVLRAKQSFSKHFLSLVALRLAKLTWSCAASVSARTPSSRTDVAQAQSLKQRQMVADHCF